MPKTANLALALLATVCVLLVCVTQASGQSAGDSSVRGPIAASANSGTTAPTDTHTITASAAETVRRNDSERITALEEALRLQSAQLELLREMLSEQSRLISELRTLPVSSNPSVDRVAERTVADSGAQGSQQTVIDERLATVEAQVKKTNETVSKQLGSMTFSGDMRLRFESIFGQSNALPNGENPAILGNELSLRFRPRIRARFAVRGVINDEFDWGLRLATGSFADNISTNQTLTDFFNRKPFGLDQAFINYKPKQIKGLRIQAGKFEPPWSYTEMTLDTDVMVEGVNESYSRDFKGTMKNLTLVAWQLPFLERNSAFVRNADGTVNVDQSRRGGRDLALYGGHLRTRFEPSEKTALTLSISDLYFSGTQFISPVQVFGSNLLLPVTFTIPATSTTPAQTITTQVSIPRDMLVAGNGNLGLTTATNNAVNRDGRLASGYNLVDMIARLELKHSQRFPVTFLFNFVTNTQVHDVVLAGLGGSNLVVPNKENNGFWAEVQVGKTRERGDLQFGYTLMRIEKDAVLTPFNFSDVTQQSDMRAHRLNFSYTVDPRVILTLTGIVTQRPTGLLGALAVTPPGSLNRPTKRLQFDTVFRF